MRDFDLVIRTLKDKPRGKMIEFVHKMSSEYAGNKDLLRKLERLLKSNSLVVKERPQRFLSIVLLSCILADIGDQMSAYIRNENIKRIKSICKKENIKYEQLVDLTACGNGMIEILSLFMGTKEPIKLVGNS